ncbi:hypothetical protein HID58_077169, partial [Brassica napus]
SWSVPRIRELIVEEDVECVLQTPIDVARQDQKMWGFSRNGIYNSKIPEGVNSLAFEIAASVTTGLRYQSYIASGGPFWLSPAIRNQALP